jgi:putative glutamine amidotransferase
MGMSLPIVLVAPGTRRRGVEFDDFSLDVSNQYPLAIQASGAIPLVLSCLNDPQSIAEAVRHAHGVMLTGGDDVETSLYRTDLPPALARTVSPPAPERDLFELLLIDEVFRQRKPLLAICRGHQMLNVALGGTLIVDIPSQVPKALRHGRSDKKNDIVHEINVQPGSLLAEVAGGTVLGVNSAHHQAVEKIAKPLRATAVSIDGIIEGMELGPESRYLLPYLVAVQFHPERLFARHKKHWDLFRGFTDACRRCYHGPKKV